MSEREEASVMQMLTRGQIELGDSVKESFKGILSELQKMNNTLEQILKVLRK